MYIYGYNLCLCTKGLTIHFIIMSEFLNCMNLDQKSHNILSNESQKGTITISRCSVENKMGAIHVQKL